MKYQNQNMSGLSFSLYISDGSWTHTRIFLALDQAQAQVPQDQNMAWSCAKLLLNSAEFLVDVRLSFLHGLSYC